MGIIKKDRLNKLTLPSLPGDNWHENFIVHLASIVRPKVYVELGLYQCVLFNQIIPYAEKLIGLDIEEKAGNYMNKNKNTTFVCSSTESFANELDKNPITIDMLFIDADHSKESVEEDFNRFFPFVRPHGLILMHDGHPKDETYTQSGFCGDGYLAIEKLSKFATDYEMVTIPVSPGLTICRKRKAQLSWKGE